MSSNTTMSSDTFSVGIPRCITCGGVTGGAIQKIYNIKRLEKINRIMEGENITDYSIVLDIDVDTDDILDDLKVNCDCCRKQLIAWKKFE